MTGSGLSDILHSTAFEVTRNLVLFLVAVFWLGLAFWVYRDARRRVDDPWLVATATAVGLVPFIGPLVYLLFRPPETLADVGAREIELRALKAHLRRPHAQCPVCRSGIEANYLVCPVCTTQLKAPCVRCSAPLEPLWQACPFCATPVGAAPTPAEAEPPGADLDAALTAEAIAIPREAQRRKKPRPSRAAAS
ncbi:MAG TPA: zinc ribbon domain-containing protein [Solirubrobacteraceae bacterium]